MRRIILGLVLSFNMLASEEALAGGTFEHRVVARDRSDRVAQQMEQWRIQAAQRAYQAKLAEQAAIAANQAANETQR